MTSETPETGLDEYVEELLLGSARGGRKKGKDLVVEIIRSLGLDDVEALMNPPTVGAAAQNVIEIRQRHHQLAQVLARGFDHTDASMLTGYSPSYISILVHSDPAFQELLAVYSAERQKVFADALERMRIAGLSALDELMNRLEAEPEKWTKRELMEFQRLCLIEPNQAGRAGASPAGSSGAVTVNVSFVETKPARTGVVDLEGTDLP